MVNTMSFVAEIVLVARANDEGVAHLQTYLNEEFGGGLLQDKCPDNSRLLSWRGIYSYAGLSYIIDRVENTEWEYPEDVELFTRVGAEKTYALEFQGKSAYVEQRSELPGGSLAYLI